MNILNAALARVLSAGRVDASRDVNQTPPRAPVIRWHIDTGTRRIACRWIVPADEPPAATRFAARIGAILQRGQR